MTRVCVFVLDDDVVTDQTRWWVLMNVWQSLWWYRHIQTGYVDEIGMLQLSYSCIRVMSSDQRWVEIVITIVSLNNLHVCSCECNERVNILMTCIPLRRCRLLKWVTCCHGDANTMIVDAMEMPRGCHEMLYLARWWIVDAKRMIIGYLPGE